MKNNRSTSLLFSDMHCSTENPVTAVPKATHEKMARASSKTSEQKIYYKNNLTAFSNSEKKSETL